MNRRQFLKRAACGGGLALAGCASRMDERKEPPVAASGPSTAPADRPGWDISVCGLNCAKCKLLEQDRCAGCRGPLDRHWSPDCQFRACAEAKDHGYCFECADFPCQKLRAFAADGHEHHRLTVENMKKMKELGLEKWLARQPRPMFCPGWKF